jgi:DNA processing protein
MGGTQSPDDDRVHEDLVDQLRLTMVEGVGPRIRRVLLDRFGSAGDVFAAAPSELKELPGVGTKLVRKITFARDEIDCEAELSLCREHGITVIGEQDEAYPQMLREIPDPPGILFVRGGFQPSDALSIAIVGTRHATKYGLQQAERLASALVRAGVTVVSGLARGIDAAAHRGALAAGGRTIAVLGGGILKLYPPEHKNLAEDVVAGGALISEAPPRTAPHAGCFPQRNRIISGLSLGSVIVEAGDRSGALITARLAMEQGREVFAVPGRVDSRASRGCHRLIRDGAKLVESVDDILEELGPLVEAATRDNGQVVRHPAELTLNDTEQRILGAIDTEATSIDQIVTDTGLPVPRVLSTISVLEMRRLVRRLSGNSVARI